MNVIKIYLKESGSIAQLYKDFNLYRGCYRNAQISIYVPKSILYSSGYTNAVKTGAMLTATNGQPVTTQAVFASYEKDETVLGVEYAVFTQLLPKEYTMYAGTTTVVVNVVNMDDTADPPVVESIVTSQTAPLVILNSAQIEDDAPVDPSEAQILEGRINALQQSLTQEVTDRTAADTALEGKIEDIVDGTTPIAAAARATNVIVFETLPDATEESPDFVQIGLGTLYRKKKVTTDDGVSYEYVGLGDLGNPLGTIAETTDPPPAPDENDNYVVFNDTVKAVYVRKVYQTKENTIYPPSADYKWYYILQITTTRSGGNNPGTKISYTIVWTKTEITSGSGSGSHAGFSDIGTFISLDSYLICSETDMISVEEYTSLEDAEAAIKQNTTQYEEKGSTHIAFGFYTRYGNPTTASSNFDFPVMRSNSEAEITYASRVGYSRMTTNSSVSTSELPANQNGSVDGYVDGTAPKPNYCRLVDADVLPVPTADNAGMVPVVREDGSGLEYANSTATVSTELINLGTLSASGSLTAEQVQQIGLSTVGVTARVIVDGVTRYYERVSIQGTTALLIAADTAALHVITVNMSTNAYTLSDVTLGGSGGDFDPNGTYNGLTAGKAVADGGGNNIPDTYATKTEVSAKYTKPATGIPESDLAQAVQTSLGNADSAYQKPSSGIPESDLSQAVQDKLNSGGGGGDTPAIPTPSASDNGKVLGVESGAYALVEGDWITAESVIVRMTELPSTVDETSPDFVEVSGILYRKKYVVTPADDSVLEGKWNANDSVTWSASTSNFDGGKASAPIGEWGTSSPTSIYGATYRSDALRFYNEQGGEEYVVDTDDGMWYDTSPVTFFAAADSYSGASSLLAHMKIFYIKADSESYLYEEVGQVPLANGTNAGTVNPVAKTDGMTQEVGVGTDGKLYTAPSSGGADVPTPTVQDAGKVLAVNSAGEYALVDGGGVTTEANSAGGTTYTIKTIGGN